MLVKLLQRRVHLRRQRRDVRLPPPGASRKAVLAFWSSSGLVNSLYPARPIVLAATSMPFWPMPIPDAAVACQEWAAVPATQVAAVICPVGQIQLTSATSSGFASGFPPHVPRSSCARLRAELQP